MNLTELTIASITQKDASERIGCSLSTLLRYRQELSKHFNQTDFDWFEYSKVISVEAFTMLQIYAQLIPIVGKKQAIREIKQRLKG